jgi:hydrogenase-1 operon protein HyaE
MTAALAWKPPRSAISNNFNGLLDKLVSKHDIAECGPAEFQTFMESAGNGVILFTEAPDTAPENWDVAVIFPELLTAMSSPIRAALVRPEHAPSLQTRFGINRFPALLFVRDGGYLGVIEGLRDWSSFVTECSHMLQKPAGRIPSIGVAVSVATTTPCH